MSAAALEYAPLGLAGILTPQANTTVEPELAVLMPPGIAWINGRLMSSAARMEDRLRDYFRDFAGALRQFANAPVGVVGFACTGASYLAGVDAERQQLLQLREACGVPVITAAGAVADALNALGVTQIGLVSPYDAELDEASALYWQARGFQVLERVSAFAPSSAFHPIYSLSSDAAQRGIDAISSALQQGGLPSGLQAIVMLGTGMPTLAPIARTPMPVGQPLLSCMFCLAWRCAMALQSRVPDRDSLIEWLNAPGWRARLAAQRAG